MNEGLSIKPTEFKRLPIKEQNTILYENTEELKRMMDAYKFRQKIQWAWLGALTIAFGLGKYAGLI